MPASLPRWLRPRWIVGGVALVVVGLVIALAVHVHSLLQPQRFTAMLQGDLSALGLTLKLEAPAEPMLFPHPGVRLRGVSLSNTGAETPLLSADEATIVVPWRALIHGTVAIERVDIDSPRLDLDELKALLARLPHRSGPPQLPTIATGAHLRQGTLTAHGKPLLFGVSVNTGALAPNHPFQLDASARDGSGRVFTGGLTMVPTAPRNGAIEFTYISLDLDMHGGARLRLRGTGSWRGGDALALQLHGDLQGLPAAPAAAASAGAPASSSATAGTSEGNQVTLAVVPGHGSAPMDVALTLEGADAHADLHLQPGGLAAWWNSLFAGTGDTPAPRMPIQGTANIKQLDLGWMQARGVEITASPGPAAANSAAPAASSATAH